MYQLRLLGFLLLLITVFLNTNQATADLSAAQQYLITFQAITDFAKEFSGHAELLQRPRFVRVRNLIASISIKAYASDNDIVYGIYKSAHKLSSSNDITLVANLRRRIHVSFESMNQWEFAENLGIYLGVLQRYYYEPDSNRGNKYDYLMGDSASLQNIGDSKDRSYEASLRFLRSAFIAHPPSEEPVEKGQLSKHHGFLGLCDTKVTIINLIDIKDVKFWPEDIFRSYLRNHTEKMYFCAGAWIYNFNGRDWKVGLFSDKTFQGDSNQWYPANNNIATVSTQLEFLSAFLAVKADIGGPIYVQTTARNLNNNERNKLTLQSALVHLYALERAIIVNAIVFTGNTMHMTTANIFEIEPRSTMLREDKLQLPRSVISLSQSTGGFYYTWHAESKQGKFPISEHLAEFPNFSGNSSRTSRLIHQQYAGFDIDGKRANFSFEQDRNEKVFLVSTCFGNTQPGNGKAEAPRLELFLDSQTSRSQPLVHENEVDPSYFLILEPRNTRQRWTLKVDTKFTLTCHARAYGMHEDDKHTSQLQEYVIVQSYLIQTEQTARPLPQAALGDAAAVWVPLPSSENRLQSSASSVLNGYLLTPEASTPGQFTELARFKDFKIVAAPITVPNAKFALIFNIQQGSDARTETTRSLVVPKSLNLPESLTFTTDDNCWHPSKTDAVYAVSKCFQPSRNIQLGPAMRMNSTEKIVGKKICNPCSNASTGLPILCLAPTWQNPKEVIAERVAFQCLDTSFQVPFNAQTYKPPGFLSGSSSKKCDPSLKPIDCEKESWEFAYELDRSSEGSEIRGYAMDYDMFETEVKVVRSPTTNMVTLSGTCCIKKLLTVYMDPVWGTYVTKEEVTGGPGRQATTAQLGLWISIGVGLLILLALLIALIVYCVCREAKRDKYSTVPKNGKEADAKDRRSSSSGGGQGKGIRRASGKPAQV